MWLVWLMGGTPILVIVALSLWFQDFPTHKPEPEPEPHIDLR